MSPSSVSFGPDGPRAFIDREGVVSGWDAGFDSLWGRSEAQALGSRIDQLLVALEPSALPSFADVQRAGVWSGIVALVPTNGNAPRPSGVRLLGKEGADTLELQLAPLSVLASDGATTDAPLEAGRDLQRYLAMLEAVPGFCYTVDSELFFTSSAGKGLVGLGLHPGQVIGVNLRDLWGTREDTYEPLVCHLKALAGIPTTYTDVCLGRSLEYWISPLRDPSGKISGAIGVGVDVTELRRARQELAKLTAQLMQAQKVEALGRLAGGIAHDFNNFLTCIMGNLALIERFVGDPEARTLLEHANTAVDSAASLTRQLLSFSRKQVISPRPINVSALVERLGKMLLRLIGDRIRLRLDCSPDLWIVNADPGQLEQVLINLVMNARDAIADEGQVSIETRNLDSTQPGAAVPEPLRPGKYVALTVTDTGRGLSDHVRARLFEPFFTTKDAGEGTGLGLATAYQAVQQNGGVITVQSELGKGSIFRVLLPQVEATPSNEPPPALGRNAALAARGGTETILLVEEEPLVLELAHRTLQQLGYNVLPCGGPDEALRIFGEYQSRIELLVTDLVLPGMTGRELASRVASLSPGIAMLFISGHGESKPSLGDDEPLASRFAPAGAAGFIRKPYRPRELALEVRSLLDQRRKTR